MQAGTEQEEQIAPHGLWILKGILINIFVGATEDTIEHTGTFGYHAGDSCLTG